MKQNHLILITSEFPFGSSETFLENEIQYLSEGFETVTIVSQDTKSLNQRTTQSNVSVLRYEKNLSAWQKLCSMFAVFDAKFWREISIIKKYYSKSINISILKTMFVSLYQAKKLKTFITKNIKIEEHQIFYSYWCDDSALALALLKKQHPNIKMLSRIHGWDVYFEVSSIQYLPFRHFIASQLSIYTISQKGIDNVLNSWKVKNASIHLSRLGTNNPFSPFNDRAKTFTLISCSNLIPLKRIHLLVEALQNIAFPLRWIHFGDGVLMEELKNKSKSLPSNIQVEFRGRISNQEILQSYNELKPHLFINVSSSEGIPVSIMEAMSFGIPVIATNVGGNSEIVNAKNGVLLSENPAVQEVTDAIQRFFSMGEQDFQSYSTAAYETWNEQYNAETNYREFVRIIQSFDV